MKKNFFSIFLILGIIIISMGFLMHFIDPMQTHVRKLDISPNELYHENIKLDQSLTRQDYRMAVDIDLYMIPNNITVRFLNSSQYESFINGTIELIDTKSCLKNFDDLTNYFFGNGSMTWFSYSSVIEISSDHYQEYHLLINNTDSNITIVGFNYISISMVLYDWSILIIAIGAAFIFISFIIYFWSERNWKRTMLIGIFVSTELFFFRWFLLSDLMRISFRSLFDLTVNTWELTSTEFYYDFEYHYLGWMEPFAESGFLNLYSGDLQGYQYGPLFIITLFPFYIIPGIPLWKVGIPIFLYHIGTGLLIYLICKKRNLNQKTSNRCILFYFLNPFSLFYGSLCWLNTAPFIFFIVLALSFILNPNEKIRIRKYIINKYYLAMISLGIAFLYKQFVIIFIPLFIITIYSNYKNKGNFENKIIKKIFLFFRICFKYGFIFLAVSFSLFIPFLITDFSRIINYVFFDPVSFSIEYIKILHPSFPINFDSFFVGLKFPVFIQDIIAYAIIYWIPFILALIMIYISYLRESKRTLIKMDDNTQKAFNSYNLFFWCLILIISMHIFYPRGSYKYYLLLLMPILALYIGFKQDCIKKNIFPPKNKTWKEKNVFIIMILLLIIIISISRYVYFLILFIWEIYYIIKKRKQTKKIQFLNI